MAEWLYEDGIGEARAALVADGVILEACVEIDDGAVRAGAAPPEPLTLSPSDVGVSALVLLLPVVITGLSKAQDCARSELGAHLVEDPVVPCPLKAGALLAARLYLAVAAGVLAFLLALVVLLVFGSFVLGAPSSASSGARSPSVSSRSCSNVATSRAKAS